MADSLFISSFKHVLIAVVFILLVCIISARIGDIYAEASTENRINTFNQRRFDDFYALPENSLDTVFIGSSHSYCTFDPEIIDAALGTSSFQMGMPLQRPDSTYFTLMEILNYQRPKTVVLEVYWGLLSDDFDLNQAVMLFQVMKNDALKNRYMSEVFPLAEKLKYNVNIFKYQIDYLAFANKKAQEYIEQEFGVTKTSAEQQQGTEYYRSKGYVYCDYQMIESKYYRTNQFRGLNGKSFEMSSVQRGYIQKIIDLCNAEGIELIMVTAPIANISMGYIANYGYIHDIVARIADDNEIPYIDYNLINAEESLLTNANFRDDAHLNHSGIEIVDKHFAEVLGSLQN